LKALAIVQCGETYHIKLAVSDAGDGILNSAVFLESESFYSPGVTVSVNTPTVIAGQPAVVEGCVTATFTFSRPTADDTTVFPIVIEGNAINGVDYSFIADSVVLFPGEFSKDITFSPFLDTLVEGVDTILVTVFNITPCGDTIPQTATIYIYDAYSLSVTANDVIGNCPGDSVAISASASGGYPAYTFGWSSGDTGATVFVTPMATDTFYVSVNDDAGCLGLDTVEVTVHPLPIVDAGPDTTVCISSPVVIGGAPTGPPGATYSWVPTATLNNPAIANPTVTTPVTTTYTVTVTDTNGCIDSAQVTVTTTPTTLADAGPDTTFCIGPSVLLGGSPTGFPGSTYSWLPITDLNNAAIANPTTSSTSSITYTVTVTDINGCIGSDAVSITVNPLPFINAGTDATICSGDSTQLNAIGLGTFSWNPTTGLSDSTISNPFASPVATTVYTVILTDINSCSDSDSVTNTKCRCRTG